MMNKFLNIFSFCKVISGKENAIICDFQKKNIKYIPDSMQKVIKMFSEKDYSEVENFFSDQKEVFDSYVNFLITEKFAFFSDIRDEFLPISKKFESPQVINNSIIEYDYDNYHVLQLIEELDNLNCQFLEIRFLSYRDKDLKKIEEILNFCNDLVLRSIKIYLPFISYKTSSSIYYKLKKYKKLEVSVFYEANRTKAKFKKQNILFTKKGMQDIRNKNFDNNDLIIDFEYYIEAIKYNPYYNKKICVDYLGNIKNCLKNNAVFGNINERNILQILKETNFTDFWHVSHDMIIGLKDDELRYNRLISNDMENKSKNLYQIIS